VSCKHCPECLSLDRVFIVIWPTESVCRRCGAAPEIQLTPREIRALLRRAP
jgi:hypothetical protein